MLPTEPAVCCITPDGQPRQKEVLDGEYGLSLCHHVYPGNVADVEEFPVALAHIVRLLDQTRLGATPSHWSSTRAQPLTKTYGCGSCGRFSANPSKIHLTIPARA
jgi:hypothetical protein